MLDEEKYFVENTAKVIGDQINGIFSAFSKSGGKALTGLRAKLDLGFGDYINKSYNQIRSVKTLTSKERSVSIFDVFESPIISDEAPSPSVLKTYVGDDAGSFSKRLNHHHRYVIKATAGAGKSMLLRYIAAHMLRERSKFIPIFFELKALNQATTRKGMLFSALLDQINIQMKNVSADELEILFKSGRFAILLDGLDELQNQNRELVSEELKVFAQKYDITPIVVTSRPDDRVYGWAAFETLNLCPLSRESALALIDKAPYSDRLKTDLSDLITKEYWRTNFQYLSNPLLVSMVLLTFKDGYSIPTKRHNFYEGAVQSLFQRHDAAKELSRERYVDIDLGDFSRVMAAFSLLSFGEEQYSFDSSSLIRYLSEALEVANVDLPPGDFQDEVVKNVCLLVQGGTKYAFIHRSFQEFFVAKYLSTLHLDDATKIIHMLFDKGKYEPVIALTFGLCPDAIEKSLIVPALVKIVEGMDPNKEDDVLDFASRVSVNAITIKGDLERDSRSARLVLSDKDAQAPFMAEFELIYQIYGLYSDTKLRQFSHVVSEPGVHSKVIDGFSNLAEGRRDKLRAHLDLFESLLLELSELHKSITNRHEMKATMLSHRFKSRSQ